MPISVRPFQRGDREQLTALVNAHAAAVFPGASISVNAVMSQLARQVGVEHLLAYAWPEQEDRIGFYEAVGFRELTRRMRGWVRAWSV
jgi:hypothetical protein